MHWWFMLPQAERCAGGNILAMRCRFALNELFARDVLLRQAEVHIVMIVRAVGPQDVEPLAATANAHINVAARPKASSSRAIPGPRPDGTRPRNSVESSAQPHADAADTCARIDAASSGRPSRKKPETLW